MTRELKSAEEPSMGRQQVNQNYSLEEKKESSQKFDMDNTESFDTDKSQKIKEEMTELHSTSLLATDSDSLSVEEQLKENIQEDQQETEDNTKEETSKLEDPEIEPNITENEENPFSTSEKDKELDDSNLEQTSKEAEEAQSSRIASNPTNEEEIVFKEILELSNQKIGLNQSSWELLETIKHGVSLNRESFGETILDLSHSTDEISMDQILDWLSEITGSQAEVEATIDENRYLLQLIPKEHK